MWHYGETWCYAVVVLADANGNYSVAENELPDRVNAVDFVSSDNNSSVSKVSQIAMLVASEFGWEAIDSETDTTLF